MIIQFHLKLDKFDCIGVINWQKKIFSWVGKLMNKNKKFKKSILNENENDNENEGRVIN